jgi:hypothetical protein
VHSFVCNIVLGNLILRVFVYRSGLKWVRKALVWLLYYTWKCSSHHYRLPLHLQELMNIRSTSSLRNQTLIILWHFVMCAIYWTHSVEFRDSHLFIVHVHTHPSQDTPVTREGMFKWGFRSNMASVHNWKAAVSGTLITLLVHGANSYVTFMSYEWCAYSLGNLMSCQEWWCNRYLNFTWIQIE